MSQAPDFATAKPPAPRQVWRLLGWGIPPLLLLVLVLQVVVADRARLAADPQWRPRIVSLCAWLGCSVPPWHEPQAFHVTARELRPHPTAPGALLVTATFRNDAAHAQAWPVLQLSLANLDGDPLGLRRFTPREYLGSEPSNPWIGPGQSASVTLEVLDPGKRAVTFEFDFR